MTLSGAFEDYLDRHARLEPHAAAGRKLLDRARFERLSDEIARLKRRMDPDDIQLDDWKRLDELNFLLVLGGEEEEE